MKKSNFSRIIRLLAGLMASAFLVTAIINIHVISVASPLIAENPEAIETDYDLIEVLGSRVNEQFQPLTVLRLRLEKSREVAGFQNEAMIICSGDNRLVRNRETDVMKNYLIADGLPEERIICDEDGYRTWESIKGLQKDFGGKSVILITQRYHLYRALYIAHSMGIEAIGIAADDPGTDMLYRNVREYLARVKDFALCMFGF